MPRHATTLHQFLYSPYNEKARWALDWKRIPHTRKSYLPGPHVPRIRRLSGQNQTPVLCLNGEILSGSATILDALEQRFDEGKLYPADPTLKQRALQIQERFDHEIGPAIRTALFSVLIEEPEYLCRLFTGGKTALTRAIYRATFPIAKSMMARAHGTHEPRHVARALEIARRGLDAMAEQIGPRGYLVGDSFTVADLSVASFVAILLKPDHPDMARPLPMPERLEAFLARWEHHPTADWALEQYRRHRPPACAIADRA